MNIIIKFLKDFGIIDDYQILNERKEFKKLYKKIRKEVKLMMKFNESFNLFRLVKTLAPKGNIAEVGVYQGGSAKIICEAKGNSNLYLFDTFKGIPETEDIDISFRKGLFKSDVIKVKNYLKDYSNVEIFKGTFPNNIGYIESFKFIFVHLDVDTYKSTMNCLQFFYPRMEKGGVILGHDYLLSKGVKKAFDEFFEYKEESILEVEEQCLIVRLE